MRKIVFILLCVVTTLSLHAQQWEIDYGDTESYAELKSGIINAAGDAVLVGLCGRDNNNYNPMIMRVSTDGEYTTRVFDSVVWNVRLEDIVQLENGNYIGSATSMKDFFGGKSIRLMVLDSAFNLITVKHYDRPDSAAYITAGPLLVEGDGTVVMSGTYKYETDYGYESWPYFFRLDANADTIDSRFVTAELPQPEAYIHSYKCIQLFRDPSGPGLVVLARGLYGRPSIMFYDSDFNYVDGFNLDPEFRQYFQTAYSDHWLSDDRLLIMGEMWPGGGYDRMTVGMADVGLDGTFGRWDRVYHKKDSAVQAPRQCMAYVNDTTIYGASFFYREIGDDEFASVILSNTDMELLGRKEFRAPEYDTKRVSSFVLPMADGACLLGTVLRNGSYTNVKLIKLSREDLNPIPCRVKEVSPETITAHAFPNPATSELNIDISGLPENKTHRIQVTDGNGRCCLNRIIRGRGNVFALDVSCFRAGLYTYSIYNDEKDMIRGKFVKE